MEKEYEVQKRIDSLLERVTSEFEIQLNTRDYPSTYLSKGNQVSYSPDLNYLHLREEDLDDGEVLGEDAIAHPLRKILRQYANQRKLEKEKSSFLGKIKTAIGKHYPENADSEKDDPEVSEFFGYIGRRMLEQVAKPEDNLKFGKKRKPIDTPEHYRHHHETGYKYAKQIDLKKIKDFQRFFELSQEEVRARFFRQDPQYDLSKPVQVSGNKKNSKERNQPTTLEGIVKIIAPIFLIISIFLISKKTITGNMIGVSTFDKTLPILTILIMSLVFMILIRYKK